MPVAEKTNAGRTRWLRTPASTAGPPTVPSSGAMLDTYFEGGFSRKNYQQWKKEEIRFLEDNGEILHAFYKKMGYAYKKYVTRRFTLPSAAARGENVRAVSGEGALGG